MLPTPKNEFTITPSQVSKESKAPLLPYALMKPKTIPKPANTPKDEDDNDVGSDFFSLTKTYPEDEHVEPIDIDKLNAEYNKPTTSKPVKPTVPAQSNVAVASTLQNYTNYQVPESSNVAMGQNSVKFDDSAVRGVIPRASMLGGVLFVMFCVYVFRWRYFSGANIKVQHLEMWKW